MLWSEELMRSLDASTKLSRGSREVSLRQYLAQIQPLLEYSVDTTQVPTIHKDVDTLERVLWRPSRLIKGLDSRPQGERLKGLGLFNFSRTRLKFRLHDRSGTIWVYHLWIGGLHGSPMLFPLPWSIQSPCPTRPQKARVRKPNIGAGGAQKAATWHFLYVSCLMQEWEVMVCFQARAPPLSEVMLTCLEYQTGIQVSHSGL